MLEFLYICKDNVPDHGQVFMSFSLLDAVEKSRQMPSSQVLIFIMRQDKQGFLPTGTYLKNGFFRSAGLSEQIFGTFTVGKPENHLHV